MKANGIDVSVYQGEINWQEVRSGGADFVMIKATQGRSERNPNVRLFMDRNFRQNIIGAASWGLRCGVWHYLTAADMKECEEEARLFVSSIEPFRDRIKLFAAVDVESEYLTKNKQLLTKLVDRFCEIVQEAGFEPAVYTNPDWMRNRLNPGRWPLWLALWRNADNLPTVQQYPNLYIWQWGAKPHKGMVGDVDRDIMIRDPHPPKIPKPTPARTEAELAEEWITENKIMLGNESGDLMPDAPMTRGQFAVMLYRFYKNIIE